MSAYRMHIELLVDAARNERRDIRLLASARATATA